jgi:hypothetical protein
MDQKAPYQKLRENVKKGENLQAGTAGRASEPISPQKIAD